MEKLLVEQSLRLPHGLLRFSLRRPRVQAERQHFRDARLDALQLGVPIGAPAPGTPCRFQQHGTSLLWTMTVRTLP